MTNAADKLPPPPANNKPPGWGEDELSKFIEAAHQNQYATFVRKRDVMAKLVSIDSLFAKVTEGWLNPSNEIVAMLYIRCLGAYRTACSLAMSGQATECYVQCRSALEYAAYAVHIDRNPKLGEVWLNRHADGASMKASKQAFQHVIVAESVKAANHHAGERFEKIYQRTIDFGGHPNELSVTANMKMIEKPGHREMLAILLHTDGVQLDLALKTTAQSGIIASKC